jgi:hypothetical protein
MGGGVGPVVRYAYQYEGVVYEGTRLVFAAGLALEGSRPEVERFLAPLREGTAIAVHVSPRDPRISVVRPGVDRRIVIVIFVASFFVVMGIGGILGWWK